MTPDNVCHHSPDQALISDPLPLLGSSPVHSNRRTKICRFVPSPGWDSLWTWEMGCRELSYGSQRVPGTQMPSLEPKRPFPKIGPHAILTLASLCSLTTSLLPFTLFVARQGVSSFPSACPLPTGIRSYPFPCVSSCQACPLTLTLLAESQLLHPDFQLTCACPPEGGWGHPGPTSVTGVGELSWRAFCLPCPLMNTPPSRACTSFCTR